MSSLARLAQTLRPLRDGLPAVAATHGQQQANAAALAEQLATANEQLRRLADHPPDDLDRVHLKRLVRAVRDLADQVHRQAIQAGKVHRAALDLLERIDHDPP